jgi:D-alanine-D-alanine ligase
MNDADFFRHGSPYLAHPLLTAERTAVEIDFIESVLDLADGAQILDVGCGFGRHSVELARRGYDVVGIDPAAAMIAAACQNAEAAAVAVDFRQARGEEFEISKRFDAAVCLFTTLGQVDEQGSNSGLVQQVWTLLKPGGWFVVEVPQRETTVKQLRAADRFGDEDVYTTVTRQFGAASQTMDELFRVVNQKEVQLFRLRYHLFSSEELVALLIRSGFLVHETLGDYSGTPLAADHPMMLMIARKEG